MDHRCLPTSELSSPIDRLPIRNYFICSLKDCVQISGQWLLWGNRLGNPANRAFVAAVIVLIANFGVASPTFSASVSKNLPVTVKVVKRCTVSISQPIDGDLIDTIVPGPAKIASDPILTLACTQNGAPNALITVGSNSPGQLVRFVKNSDGDTLRVQIPNDAKPYRSAVDDRDRNRKSAVAIHNLVKDVFIAGGNDSTAKPDSGVLTITISF